METAPEGLLSYWCIWGGGGVCLFTAQSYERVCNQGSSHAMVRIAQVFISSTPIPWALPTPSNSWIKAAIPVYIVPLK